MKPVISEKYDVVLLSNI